MLYFGSAENTQLTKPQLTNSRERWRQAGQAERNFRVVENAAVTGFLKARTPLLFSAIFRCHKIALIKRLLILIFARIVDMCRQTLRIIHEN